MIFHKIECSTSRYFENEQSLLFLKSQRLWIFTIFVNFQFPTIRRKFHILSITYLFFQKNRTSSLKHRTTEHRGREGEHEQVTMCCLETTVYFSPVIDRPRVSVSIVRGLCDDWSKIKSASFITDEQMHSHCVQEKTRQTWLPFEFIAFLCGVFNLTFILVGLHLQMSSQTCMWKMRSCGAQDSGTMVDVSQVMIAHTITCQIHVSRHTTPWRNELNWNCSYTEILSLLTMKLELLSPLLSDSPFLSSKVFLFFRFSNLTVEWTKWNHACWGPRKLSILNSFLVFPRPVNFAAVEQSSVGMKNSQKLSSKTSSETRLVSVRLFLINSLVFRKELTDLYTPVQIFQ